MRDEPVGQLARERAHAAVDAAEVDRRGGGVLVRARVEVRLHPGDPVVLALECRPLAGAERAERRLDRPDVLAHAGGGLGPRHSVPVLDVLLDLGAEPEVEAPAREAREVPGGVRGQHRRPRERERDGGAHHDPLGVLQRQQGERERVVHGLRDLEPVVPGGLRATRVGGHVAQRDPRVHSGVDLHHASWGCGSVAAPSSEAATKVRPRSTMPWRTSARRAWSKRLSIQARARVCSRA